MVKTERTNKCKNYHYQINISTTMNHFQLFDIPQNYIIDQAFLQKSYFALQAKHHPDRARSDEERRKNLEHSMLINEAFKILKDDYLRSKYMLELQGQAFDEIALKGLLLPSELEERLDQYELIENISDILSLSRVEEAKLIEQELLVQNIGTAFEQNNIKQALELTLRLKYLTNLVGNIKLKIRNG